MLDTLTYPDGSIVTRDHTDRNELHKVHYDADGTGSGTPVTIDTRTYDDGGRLTNIAHGNGLSTAVSYRDDNLVSSIDVTGATGLDFTYTWDANKNKLTEAINAPMDDYGFTATYDDEDRLLTWERDNGNLDQSWSLSAVGNWNSFTENTVTETRTHGDAHELTAIGGTSLTYDAKGNLTTNVNSHTYTWDMDNMLQSATVPSGSTEGIVGTHEYEYDALGRRVAKVVEESGTDTTTLFVQKTTPIAYSPHAGQVLAEYEFTTGSPALVRKYAYGDYIDEPLVLINVSGASETMYYYHRNQQYSVCGLTDASGSVLEYVAYDPYGNMTISSSYGNIVGYTGRHFDGETKLWHFRRRQLHASTGRFLSRDTIVKAFHAYAAKPNCSRMDPSGKSWLYPKSKVKADDECCKKTIKMWDYWNYSSSQECQAHLMLMIAVRPGGWLTAIEGTLTEIIEKAAKTGNWATLIASLGAGAYTVRIVRLNCDADVCEVANIKAATCNLETYKVLFGYRTCYRVYCYCPLGTILWTGKRKYPPYHFEPSWDLDDVRNEGVKPIEDDNND